MLIHVFPAEDEEGGFRRFIKRSRVELGSRELHTTRWRWMKDESRFDFRRHRTLTSLFSRCASGALSHGIKQMAHEADKSLPSSTKVKNMWNYTATSPHASWRGAWLSTGINLSIRGEESASSRCRAIYDGDLSRQIRDFLNYIFSNRKPTSNVLRHTTAWSLSCDTNSISMYQKIELFRSSVVQPAVNDLLFNALWPNSPGLFVLHCRNPYLSSYPGSMWMHTA